MNEAIRGLAVVEGAFLAGRLVAAGTICVYGTCFKAIRSESLAENGTICPVLGILV